MGYVFFVGLRKFVFGFKVSRINLIFKFIYLFGYIGFSLIKRKDERFFFKSLGLEKLSVLRVKIKVCII